MLPPNCSTRHARSFKVSKISSQRVTDLEAATRQLRQISCILDSCTISASYEVSQAQKALLLLPHTAKGASTSSEELNAQISPRTDDEHNLPYHEKTIGKRTSVLEFTANRNDGALRDVLVECLSPLPHSGSLQVNCLLALCPSSKHH